MLAFKRTKWEVWVRKKKKKKEKAVEAQGEITQGMGESSPQQEKQ